MSSPSDCHCRSASVGKNGHVCVQEALVHNDEKPASYKQSIRGSLPQIFFSFFIISVPLTVLAALLLGLVLKYRVALGAPVNGVFGTADSVADDAHVYFVRFSATRLITVASLTSSVAPILPGLMMALYSYPIAREIIRYSEEQKPQRLPTPYQLSLLVELFHGGLTNLWDWSGYLFWKRAEKQPALLRGAASVLTISVVLGYLIVAADLWLHITTSTVLLNDIVPSNSTSLYSRSLSSYCANYYSNATLQEQRLNPDDSCVISTAVTGIFLQKDGQPSAEPWLVLANTSDVSRASAVVSKGVNYAYLSETTTDQQTDYRASTYAVAAQCKPISKQCDLHVFAGAATPYNCTPALYGDVTALTTQGSTTQTPWSGRVFSQYFVDSDFANNSTKNRTNWINPFYFAVGGIVTGGNEGLLETDDVVRPMHGGLATILGCNSTVYEMTYTVTNGSLQDVDYKIANATMGWTIAQPMQARIFSSPQLQVGFQNAFFSNSSQELADKFANSYSAMAVSLASAATDRVPVLAEQRRDPFLAARVPKAPLYTLIILNLLYALLGLVLCIWALRSHPRQTRDVQARLSTVGLVASAFEQERASEPVKNLEDVFAETRGSGYSRKVGMIRSRAGGWRFAVWDPFSFGEEGAAARRRRGDGRIPLGVGEAI